MQHLFIVLFVCFCPTTQIYLLGLLRGSNPSFGHHCFMGLWIWFPAMLTLFRQKLEVCCLVVVVVVVVTDEAQCLDRGCFQPLAQLWPKKTWSKGFCFRVCWTEASGCLKRTQRDGKCCPPPGKKILLRHGFSLVSLKLMRKWAPATIF